MKQNLEEAYGMKSFVEDLFGKRAWLEVKHSTNVRVWKKYAKRILEAISTTAKVTVEISDPEWHAELDSIIRFGQERIERAEDAEIVFASLAASLGSISFHQFGRVPRNSNKEQVTLRHQGNWKLNQYRSVQYVQNKEQTLAKQEYNKAKHSDC